MEFNLWHFNFWFGEFGSLENVLFNLFKILLLLFLFKCILLFPFIFLNFITLIFVEKLPFYFLSFLKKFNFKIDEGPEIVLECIKP